MAQRRQEARFFVAFVFGRFASPTLLLPTIRQHHENSTNRDGRQQQPPVGMALVRRDTDAYYQRQRSDTMELKASLDVIDRISSGNRRRTVLHVVAKRDIRINHAADVVRIEWQPHENCAVIAQQRYRITRPRLQVAQQLAKIGELHAHDHDTREGAVTARQTTADRKEGETLRRASKRLTNKQGIR